MKRIWRFIRNWGTLGNLVEGDCTAAAYYHVIMALEVINGSTFKRVLYRLGYRVPHSPFVVKEYTAYLATLGQKPSATTGVDPAGWLQWQQDQGNVLAWKQLPTPLTEAVLRQALDYFGGVMLGGELSQNAMGSVGPWLNFAWRYSTNSFDQPDPNLGHEVAYLDYTKNMDRCVTWGQWQYMTITFREKCFTYGHVFVHKSDPNAQAKLRILSGMSA